MKKILVGVIIGIMVVGGTLLVSGRTIKAADEYMGGADFGKKLDEILKTEKKILDTVTALKEELNIVKIRVTQQQ